MTWISQICLAVKSPETAARYRNAAIGILFVPLTQLLVVPIQTSLGSHGITLPASVLVMLMVTMVMLVANLAPRGVSNFYVQYMKGPTDFLGRHMAFGFVPPFVMLSKDHLNTAADIPRIAGAFIVTTLISYVGCYLFATGSFKLESRIRGLERRAGDIESQTQQVMVLSNKASSAKRVSQMSQLTIRMVNNESLSSIDTFSSPPAGMEFLVRTSPLWITLFLLLTVGVPIYCATGYDMPFEAFCFVFLWIGTILFQRSLRTLKTLAPYPRLKYSLVVVCNPVLIVAALGTAYFWIKGAATHKTIEAVLDNFKRHDDWAEIVTHIAQDHGDPRRHIGAADLATALLDAGIVSLGLKMFEYRAALWRSFATVLSTSLAAAVGAVFLNVALARAVGLAASEALAFAARNVTIALGAPAVLHLGGSTTLMSALVIFSGMLFQMTGDLLFAWAAVPDIRATGVASGIQYASRGGGGVVVTEKNSSSSSNNNAATMMTSDSDAEDGKQEDGGPIGQHGAECKIIAAGVTVGINAAAMGTTHLLERDSMATAYSALSMIMFGCITVGLTSIPTVAQALKALAT